MKMIEFMQILRLRSENITSRVYQKNRIYGNLSYSTIALMRRTPAETDSSFNILKTPISAVLCA